MGKVYPIKDVNKISEIKNILLKNNKHRDWIMISIGIYTGLRISDILKLKVKDVKNKDYIRIKAQKTSKNTVIAINEELKKELKEYIKDKSANEYLIKTIKKEDGEEINKPISSTQAYRIMKYVGKKAKIKVNIGTHTLRKTYGYYLYKNNDISIVQGALNHENQLDTLKYIGVEEEEINKATKSLRFL